jgi:hypothetical protein
MIFELNVAFLVIKTQKIVKNYQIFSEKILKFFLSVENKKMFSALGLERLNIWSKFIIPFPETFNLRIVCS